ncbi:MAG: hypothetical protein ACKPKO_08610, partial [Candidatus Fonsibacter sp.]
MQYMWCRPALKEQAVINKDQIKPKAHIAVEGGRTLMHWLGKSLKYGRTSFTRAIWLGRPPNIKRNMFRTIFSRRLNLFG